MTVCSEPSSLLLAPCPSHCLAMSLLEGGSARSFAVVGPEAAQATDNKSKALAGEQPSTLEDALALIESLQGSSKRKGQGKGKDKGKGGPKDKCKGEGSRTKKDNVPLDSVVQPNAGDVPDGTVYYCCKEFDEWMKKCSVCARWRPLPDFGEVEANHSHDLECRSAVKCAERLCWKQYCWNEYLDLKEKKLAL